VRLPSVTADASSPCETVVPVIPKVKIEKPGRTNPSSSSPAAGRVHPRPRRPRQTSLLDAHSPRPMSPPARLAGSPSTRRVPGRVQRPQQSPSSTPLGLPPSTRCGRGAPASQIAVLVVAADDGFMPQTDEALKHIQNAKVASLSPSTRWT